LAVNNCRKLWQCHDRQQREKMLHSQSWQYSPAQPSPAQPSPAQQYSPVLAVQPRPSTALKILTKSHDCCVVIMQQCHGMSSLCAHVCHCQLSTGKFPGTHVAKPWTPA
jgi:hypothetical protein